MAQSRGARRILQQLSPRATRALEILQGREQAKIDINASFAAALEIEPLTFLVFACLGTVQGKEELVLDLSVTIFMKKFRRQAEQLLQALVQAEIPAQLLILLPDLEPRRTWGWQVPQGDLSGLCHMMIEDAASSLPDGWTVRLWSGIEAGVSMSTDYDEALRWAMASAPPLILRDEIRFFQELGTRHPNILTQGRPNELARRQIAAYAHEGRLLELHYPKTILLQADTPVERKDVMFNQLRRQPLAIVHPFAR